MDEKEKKQLNEKELEKVSGGGRGPTPNLGGSSGCQH